MLYGNMLYRVLFLLVCKYIVSQKSANYWSDCLEDIRQIFLLIDLYIFFVLLKHNSHNTTTVILR